MALLNAELSDWEIAFRCARRDEPIRIFVCTRQSVVVVDFGL